jgi:hypothetical protein
MRAEARIEKILDGISLGPETPQKMHRRKGRCGGSKGGFNLQGTWWMVIKAKTYESGMGVLSSLLYRVTIKN